MSKIPITVCIIAKNEEKYIEGCLKHLLPFGFEIVVADTGSTDRTKEIALKYADKVLDFEWIDDFSAARNFCAEQASNNWILAIDCDEYISSFDYAKTRILTQKLPKCLGRFNLKNLVRTSDGEERYTVDNVIRFYNKKRFTWRDAIHEQLVDINDPDTMKYHCFDMPLEVIHHGYNISAEEMREKQIRNLKLLEKQLEKNPDDSYTWFQAGQSHFILGSYANAAEAYEKAIALETNFKRYFMEILMESLSLAYVNLGRKQDAVNLLLTYAEHFKTAKYTAALADAYMENNDILKALVTYIKTVSMDDRDTLGDGLLMCYSRIIDIYNNMGQKDMADMYADLYEKCRQERARIMNQ
ncbi:MAG: glycosyltransferase [Lachnospiraceae bacterium]|nr:glycosyltransferase [Lachnospiraceae bacterium]